MSAGYGWHDHHQTLIYLKVWPEIPAHKGNQLRPVLSEKDACLQATVHGKRRCAPRSRPGSASAVQQPAGGDEAARLCHLHEYYEAFQAVHESTSITDIYFRIERKYTLVFL